MEKEQETRNDFVKRIGVDRGLVCKVDDTIIYKKYQVYLGESDIAQLVLMGYHPESERGTKAQPMYFGGDGSYHAWLCDESAEVPEHYELVALYTTWLKVYDDSELVLYIYAGHDTPIGIYRAGDYGCLIKVFK
jgi:hypothetical protein